MNMADKGDDHHDLEAMFAAARQRPVDVPNDLMARVLADADRIAAMRRPAPLWQQVRDALGGWPAVGGLVAASVAGVWIGVAPPSALPDPAELFFGTQTSSVSDTLSDGFFDMAAILEES